MGKAIRIEHDACGAYGGCRNIISPERQYQVQSSNLERYQECFVKEEVPAGHKAKGFVYPFTGHSNKTAGDGMKDGHFGDTIVDQAEEDAVKRVGEEQAQRATFLQAATNTHKQGSTDRASYRDELDLTVSKATLQLISIVSDKSFLDIDIMTSVGVVIVPRAIENAFVDILGFFVTDHDCCVGEPELWRALTDRENGKATEGSGTYIWIQLRKTQASGMDLGR